MHAELVRTTTGDELRLDGALFSPRSAAACRLDALVMLHGVGGNFYGGTLFEDLAFRLLDLGVTVLRVNTRGHDAVSWASTPAGPSRQGAAYEVVDHCRHDIRAWIDLLEQRGHHRVGLLGHSLGAVKAIYAQANDPHPAVRCVVALSPPRLSHAAFQNAPQSSTFFEAFSQARQLIQAGQPEGLFQARFPVPQIVSAASYLDKYGPEERYNVLRFLDRVRCPLLVVYGQTELKRGGIALAGMDETVKAAAGQAQELQTEAIAGADHFYTGVYESLGDSVTTWLRNLPGD